jgi:4-hydroxy-tetrahydrodipicolinate synthase
MTGSPQLQQPHGVWPMLYAFFDGYGSLDRDAFRQQIEWCVARGSHGIAMLGLLTEVSALTPEERDTLVGWAVADIAGRLPLLVTIAGRDADEATALARSAHDQGADYLVLQPPLGQQPPAAELSAFYAGIMAALPAARFGIQNAPEFLGVGLDPDDVARLRDQRRNFVLMKGEGPVVQVKRFVDRLGAEFPIFNGRGGLELVDNLLAGCAGMIPAPEAIDLQVAVYEAVRAGDLPLAIARYQRLLPYAVFAMQTLDVAILYGKRAFVQRAGIVNKALCRLPKLAPEPFFEAAAQRWLDAVAAEA